jgi:hypothetical protein
VASLFGEVLELLRRRRLLALEAGDVDPLPAARLAE